MKASEMKVRKFALLNFKLVPMHHPVPVSSFKKQRVPVCRADPNGMVVFYVSAKDTVRLQKFWDDFLVAASPFTVSVSRGSGKNRAAISRMNALVAEETEMKTLVLKRAKPHPKNSETTTTRFTVSWPSGELLNDNDARI